MSARGAVYLNSSHGTPLFEATMLSQPEPRVRQPEPSDHDLRTRPGSRASPDISQAWERVIVLANLTGGLLIRDAARIAAVAAPTARLILSGYQQHEVGEVSQPFVSLGWRIEAAREEETWCGMRLSPRSPTAS